MQSFFLDTAGQGLQRMLAPGSSWFGTGTSGVEDGLGTESFLTAQKVLVLWARLCNPSQDK